MAVFWFSKRKVDSLPDKDGTTLPDAVRAKLESLGVPDDAPVQVPTDLDAAGRWGERYLIATPQRILVLSVDGAQNGAPSASQKALELNGHANEGGTNGAAINGVANVANTAGTVSIDLDVPLDAIANAESKSLIGASALEVRIKPDSPNTEVHGLKPGQVVELLRSSNAHAKALGRAARQLQQLREKGTVEEDAAEAEKWQRQTCSNCGRALPENTKVCPFCVNKWRALRRLMGYIMPFKWVALGNGLLSVIAISLSFVSPVIYARLIDDVFHASPQSNGSTSIQFRPPVTADDYRTLGIMVGLIIVASLANSFVSVIRGRSVAFLGSRVLHNIRTQLYGHLQQLSLAYYDKREIGAVMSRVQNDVGMLQNFLLDGAENVILSSLTIIGVVVVMLTRSWQLTLLVLLPVPFVIVGTNTYWRGLMKLWRRVWHQNSTLGARLADTLGGVRVVRAFAQEDREVDRFVNKSSELRDATMRVEQKAAVFYPTLGFIMGLGGPLTWYFGGQQVLGNTLTLGGLTLFTVLLTRLYEPIQQLTRLVNFTTRAMTAAERVFEVLDTEPEIKEKADAIAMPHVEGHVEFKNVVFGYDRHRPVLHGVDLDVQPGEMIGLVGHSGAGKSTLINLLMRFYDVSEGQILVDGVDIRDIRRSDIRNQIGVVLQESYLFHGTIFDNIRYGRSDATPAEVMAAAKAAYAHDFIVSFPDGYDTLVGERGTRLSGGERQRISIARAILHNPRILILDEATASVDTETEQQIQKALQNLTRGRTTFAIAHRLSTLRNANRLIVMEGGKIAEQGTHDELMEKRGAFYKLVNAQRAMNEVLAVGG
jgi:ATP-binding cassette subfamily B protein